jgi:CubicO group peptidase (beta-lactamase class C family)
LRLALALVLAPALILSAIPAAAAAATEQTEAALRASLAEMVDTGHLPNAQVMISRHGKLLVDFRLGHLDLEDRVPLPRGAVFRLYSMTKPVTSVAAMMLVEDGRLSLDDPVSRFLPEFADMRVYASGGLDDLRTVPAARPVTVRDLLTHSSGLTYQFMGNGPVPQYYRRHGAMRDTVVGRQPADAAPAADLDELVARLGKAPLLHQPGTRFSYGYSTTVLGALVAHVSGMSLDAFLKIRILDPLDMRDTGFVVPEAQLPRFVTLYRATVTGMAPVERAETSEYRDAARLRDGGGALAGTAQDYLHFAELIANGGSWHGRRLLSRATIAAMVRPLLPTGGSGLEDTQFGFGLAIGDARSEAMGGLPVGAVSWAGSGNTYFLADPQSGIAALVMTNILMSGERTDELRKALNTAVLRLRD